MRWMLCIGFMILVTELPGHNPRIDSIYARICNALQVPLDKQPRLEIRNTVNMGAAYSKSNHTIYIEQKLIDALSVLKSQMDKALAYIIGHELCHALEKDKHDTHFLAYDKYQDATFRNEQNADIQGAFVAYLAGYNCLPVIEETINIIYQTYQLHSNLTGYPNKAERIESIHLIREQVESLIAIYKAANLLMMADQYTLAGSLFEKVNTYFPSPEVSNNIGTNLLLEAINFGKYNYFKYALPIEIAWDLRLKKPTLAPGQKEFEPEVIRKRELLLKKADILFKNLLLLHPGYFPSWNNLACLKVIQDDIKGAHLILNEAAKKFNSLEAKESLKMIRGTVYLIENNRAKALSEFRGIHSPWLKRLVHFNLNPATSNSLINNQCKVEIPATSSRQSPLLQEKTIKLDTISFTWNSEFFLIRSTAVKKEFRLVELMEQQLRNCKPLKSFNQGCMKWNESLISVFNPSDQKTVFYVF